MFKESKVLIHPTTTLLADSGYQGIVKIHSTSITFSFKARKSSHLADTSVNIRIVS